MQRLLAVMGILLLLSACGKSDPQVVDNLPWDITSTEQGTTRVFHLELGKTTLRQAIEQWHSFPELAVMQSRTNELSLEAYFGKQRLGLFEAKLVAELVADPAILEKFSQEQIKREPQASGAWRLSVSEANVKLANDFLIKYLIYIPVVNYEPELIRARFGEGAEIVNLTATVDAWFYADRNLAMLIDAKGGDMFYYSSPQDFPQLKTKILNLPAEQAHE
ncbi:hypothetical protein SAMN02745130_00282 [Thiothrix eikelboomii]|uniref:Lipoprotein n=1 Tax=Thiothrix eikelboomii TaxID=92487 RepID=A0A1T4VTR6_9GAMM|nr:hypothetical protein [Thiothrix eikelboomii]SKA68390.1 hypothetical protein SAMN02745130_00282 [Thiothrix eikelboomii]